VKLNDLRCNGWRHFARLPIGEEDVDAVVVHGYRPMAVDGGIDAIGSQQIGDVGAELHLLCLMVDAISQVDEPPYVAMQVANDLG